jgi:hypothetical protein
MVTLLVRHDVSSQGLVACAVALVGSFGALVVHVRRSAR